MIKVFRLLISTDLLNLSRLAEYRKVRLDYNRVKRVKKRERQVMINEEIKRGYGLNIPRELWSVVKSSMQDPGTRREVPPVETWPDYFKNKDSEYTRANKSNGSDDIELGQGTATYPLRQNDYNLIRPVSQQEIGEQIKKDEW